METGLKQAAVSAERVVHVQSGWTMLPVFVGLLLADIGFLIFAFQSGTSTWRVTFLILLLPICIVLLKGFFTLQPNEARVLVLFGDYKGTVRSSGFHWGNPFYTNGPQQVSAFSTAPLNKSGGSAVSHHTLGRNKISLRARTLNGQKLKVNDKRGNPIEIAAVVVWRVGDTAQATFDVDNYENYVLTQSESALRHLASLYSYDYGEDNEITLRSNVTEVSQALRAELHDFDTLIWPHSIL